MLLAISDMMDKKLKPINERLNKLEKDMQDGFAKINVILENEIRPDISLLTENYIPSASFYEKAGMEHEAMKNDIELLKIVVTEHSDKFQKIS